MQRVRVFQDPKEKKRRGSQCPWSVEWREHGRRRSKTIGPKDKAEEFAAMKRAELVDRQIGLVTKKTWADFVAEYLELRVAHFRSAESRRVAKATLNRFGELARPNRVCEIDAKLLDEYVHARLAGRGRNGDPISPETVKKDLRTIRAALYVAKEWHYIRDVPRMPNPKGHASEKRFVTAEHFDRIMGACKVATKPGPPLHAQTDPATWWEALLATAWVTGMRIGSLLALRWEDVDLDQGTVWSRARDNKGRRDLRHDIGGAIEALKRLPRSDPRVFPWNHHRRTLWVEFARIQTAAGIHLACHVKATSPEHECTDACHLYGFHDLRRAHATYNYGRVDDRALQQQMGHASFQTTQGYIKYAELHKADAYPAHLPASLSEGKQRENSGKKQRESKLKVFAG